MFEGHRLNVNMFRSSFITYLHGNNTPTNILTDASLKMRNSIIAQYKNYKKALSPADLVKIKQEPRDDDDSPIAINDIAPAPIQIPREMVDRVPQPRPPNVGYVDPVKRNHLYQERHIEKVGRAAYSKYQSDYFQNRKKDIMLQRTLTRVNQYPDDSYIMPKTIEKYKLFKKDGV
eukprot:389639-Hanusia_phi.AAC.1